MYDRFNRNITYLRLSVTDRCNFACQYCMPFRPQKFLEKDDILSMDEIETIAKEAAKSGITKIRITGGEPLMRKDIVDIVYTIAQTGLFTDIGLTTNGFFLAELAKPLARAGLMRVNVSLDAIDPNRFAEITQNNSVGMILAGIEAALEAGLTPVKINCVIDEHIFEKDAQDVASYARSRNLEVRFIRRMDLANGRFAKVIGGEGGDCHHCNRLRITANGMVKPCLFSEMGFSIRQTGVAEALRLAIGKKPERGHINPRQTFYGIGG